MKSSAPVYLASASPRRQALLAQIGIGFEVLHVEIDERPLAHESPASYVERLALAKARAGRVLLDARDPRPVLGADTAVVVDNHIMGKPGERAEGLRMLQLLSGRTHKVFSAVALAGARETQSLSCSRVTFRTLTRAECEAYWETGEPRDKAGGYAIQGHAAQFIEHLEGSYSGVMGLPLFETAQLLKEFAIKIL